MITLVLLPGMDGTGDLFDGFIAALPEWIRARVIAYPTGEPLGYDALTPFVRERLPTDGPFILLGESFSGPIAVRLAASLPPGLCGLVLCCSFVRSPSAVLRILHPLLCVTPIPGCTRRVLGGTLLGGDAKRELRAAVVRATDRVSATTLRARLSAIASVDVRDDLARVRVPVLCLRATQDRVVPRAAAELIRKCMPTTRVVDVTGPHLLLQVSPAAAVCEIDSFRRGIEAVLSPGTF